MIIDEQLRLGKYGTLRSTGTFLGVAMVQYEILRCNNS